MENFFHLPQYKLLKYIFQKDRGFGKIRDIKIDIKAPAPN